ncbi:MAG: methyltransferase domain-containing protein [Bryobacteraceae bacterium]|nr:methyltransferase domain-containing protein [Bryobacteraceae bacterium]
MRLAGIFLATVVLPLTGQIAKEANARYRDEAGRNQVAALLTSEGRDIRQKPEELVKRLGLTPGMSVADIGTGVGYLLPYLSRAVGPSGTVYAEDIFPDFLAKARKLGEPLGNVKFIQGTERSAKLPSASVDRVVILDAYHHFDFPQQMLDSIAVALKPGGRLAVIEFEKNDHSMDGRSAMQHIRLTRAEFVKEIEGFGFRAVEVSDFVPDVQWIGMFEKR